MRKALGVVVVCGVAVVTLARAEPGTGGVTAKVLSRGTFPEFKVRSDNDDFDFKAKAGSAMDIVVRQHDYPAGSRTGWHQHPGPIFLTVTKGTLTVYEYDDQTCTPIKLSADDGQHPNAYVDNGRGHIVVNESGGDATDISVITAPIAGGAFRTELPGAPVYCPK